jgi:nucleotide-binding universal stress UspA family protein
MKLERIVIGMDFSEPSITAARWAARHFAPNAEFVLVHSIELSQPPSFLRAALPPPTELEETTRQGAEQRLKEVGRSLGAERIWPEIRVGRPADQIAAIAEEYEADLIVVGEHGHSGGLWGVLGSTAEQLARAAPVPVLLAQRVPAGSPRRILLPIEESALLDTALAWGRLLAEQFQADIIGYYVVSSSLFGRMRIISSPSRGSDLESKLIQDATRWLEERLASANLPRENTTAQVVIGDPATEILAAARRFGVDLIVLPTRGAGAVGQALIGSVARSVLRGAPSPILVVNQPASDL